VLIGHLQTNKARDAARDAAEVQSLDRVELAEALHRRLANEGRTLDVLVQVKTSSEPTKYGMDPADVPAFLRRITADFPTLRVQGLMTLAVNSPDPAEVRACFRTLRELRDRLRQENLPGVSLDRLSMGMSGDFELAIEEGSTEVRIGSAIFGARSYPDPQ
jgi:pyridoxal phosphate enzyme (YggS family)